jgi:cytochrome c oxidase accessory protein FixG
MIEIDELYDGEDTFRDSLATVDKSGKRIWIYPKKPSGKFYSWRKLLSYFLLVLLFGLPWIKYKGEPFVLLNILERKFIIFGTYFSPQDFHLFGIGMLIMMLFIVLFTVIFGRLFCGWVCPQTIFMEMVFRRLEYWIEGDFNQQKKLNAAPWTTDKLFKKGIKHLIFLIIAVLIGNTFLAYLIGMDEVLQIVSEPISQHLSGFIAMMIFSVVFYLVFAFLREQVCTTICPYGRLQGVLLDQKSLAVQYDYIRGEPRGKIKKNAPEDSTKGDCIDCKLCIKVCPTGIDIRDGIQLECVNCTACIDACDEVMDKVDRPRGLIRIDSLDGIANGVRNIFNKRSMAYSAVLLVLIALESFLFMNRSQVEVLVLHTPGTIFQERTEGIISNLYNYQLINKTGEVFELEFRMVNIDGTLEIIGGEKPKTVPNGVSEGALFINIPKETLQTRTTKIELEVYNDDVLIDRVSTKFLGPFK